MTCTRCGKQLTYNELGLNKKLNGSGKPLCMCCLAEKFDVTVARLEEKIGEYLSAGCLLFVKNA